VLETTQSSKYGTSSETTRLRPVSFSTQQSLVGQTTSAAVFVWSQQERVAFQWWDKIGRGRNILSECLKKTIGFANQAGDCFLMYLNAAAMPRRLAMPRRKDRWNGTEGTWHDMTWLGVVTEKLTGERHGEERHWWRCEIKTCPVIDCSASLALSQCGKTGAAKFLNMWTHADTIRGRSAACAGWIAPLFPSSCAVASRGRVEQARRFDFRFT